MSESRTKLEQILELLLAEDNATAEDLLHEYVVAKARSEYERVLEADEEEFEETIDKSNDFEDEITEIEDDADEIDTAEIGEGEDEEGDEEGDDEDDFGGEEESPEAEEGEEDLEDKVDDLEAELEDLRAEFEALMAGEEGEEEHGDMEMDMGGDDMEMDMGDEDVMDSVEYDLDEADEADEEVVEEATKLSDNVAAPKAPNSDGSGQTSPVAKHKAGWETGKPVKAKDGSEGDKGANKAKNHTPTSNIKVEPKKV